MLHHVPVQGEGAADLIAQAIRDLSANARELGGIDAILLARGGGSLEDLWQFNEEVVARAIVASKIPVITGIGHEVDVSIADLVADYHAHTPTEAAQVAMNRWRSADEDLAVRAGRLRSALRGSVQEARSSFAAIERHEFFRKPTERVQQLRQRLDDLQEDIAGTLRERLTASRQQLNERALRLAECSPRRLLSRKQQVLAAAESRLLQHHPAQLIRLRRQELSADQSRLQLALRHALGKTRSTLDLLERHLNAVGPQQVLARGYSITTLKKGGAILRSKTQVHGGQRLITHLADGQVESVAEDPNQPTLFD
jgi:exodeoxyribonuclease VII large subunit